MDRAELLAFLRRHRLCVEASVSDARGPQAAVVGFAVSDDLELVFDTLDTTRKVENLRRDPRTALVVGWDNEQSAQIEGIADEPKGPDLDRLKRIYFAAYPDGVTRQAWPGLIYVRIRPTWVRYSHFVGPKPQIVEFSCAELGAIRSDDDNGGPKGREPARR
ncbi:MAG: pyridoxamine 5'-phosphate oxidase family protein [Polyangiaceae bacterium]|jgi:general stress protein 26